VALLAKRLSVKPERLAGEKKESVKKRKISSKKGGEKKNKRQKSNDDDPATLELAQLRKENAQLREELKEKVHETLRKKSVMSPLQQSPAPENYTAILSDKLLQAAANGQTETVLELVAKYSAAMKATKGNKGDERRASTSSDSVSFSSSLSSLSSSLSSSAAAAAAAAVEESTFEHLLTKKNCIFCAESLKNVSALVPDHVLNVVQNVLAAAFPLSNILPHDMAAVIFINSNLKKRVQQFKGASSRAQQWFKPIFDNLKSLVTKKRSPILKLQTTFHSKATNHFVALQFIVERDQDCINAANPTLTILLKIVDSLVLKEVVSETREEKWTVQPLPDHCALIEGMVNFLTAAVDGTEPCFTKRKIVVQPTAVAQDDNFSCALFAICSLRTLLDTSFQPSKDYIVTHLRNHLFTQFDNLSQSEKRICSAQLKEWFPPEKAAQAKPAAAAAPAGAQDGVKLQFSTKEAEAAQQQDVQKQLVTGVFTVHFKQESENGNY